MQMVSQRQILILSILRQNNSPVSSAVLAQKTGVSKRTLIKDIQELNQEKSIVFSTKQGYKINSDENTSVAFLLSNKIDNDKTNLLKIMLASRTAISVKKLLENLSISSSTLQKLIYENNIVLKENNLKIIRKNNSVFLDGIESDKRFLMGRLIHKESNEFFSDIENLNEYFPGFDVTETAERINSVLNKDGYRIKEYYTVNFLINVLIIISRNSYHTGIHEGVYQLPDHYEETVIAADLISEIEKTKTIVYDDYSTIVSELSRILFGFIELDWKTTAVSTMHLLSNDYINTVRTILQDSFDFYRLNINYESFLNVFSMHVYELIKRCRGSINFVPSTVSIKQTDPFVYDVAVYISQQLHNSFNITIPDSEINLIGIHIGYAIEQSDNHSNKPAIVILSNNYHSITDRIIDQISLIYGQQFEIAGVWKNLSDVPFKVASTSFIITTNKIDQFPFSGCTISPFLTLEDQKRISENLTSYLSITKHREFSRLFYQYSDHNCFVIRHQKMTKEDVIHLLSEMAIRNNDVTDDFEEHVLTREKLSSTAFYNKFAIPHSDKQSAKTTKLYIMINTAGIAWSDQTVYIVFLIVIDRKTSVEFRKLYNIIIETLYHDNSIMANIGKINAISDFIRYLSVAN